jgi:trk system potassium uptake protein TrkA
VDIIELSGEISMIEMDVKPEWVGKSLIELNLRKKYSINIVAVRNGESLSTDIVPDAPLTKDMKLVLLINKSKINKLV